MCKENAKRESDIIKNKAIYEKMGWKKKCVYEICFLKATNGKNNNFAILEILWIYFYIIKILIRNIH